MSTSKTSNKRARNEKEEEKSDRQILDELLLCLVCVDPNLDLRSSDDEGCAEGVKRLIKMGASSNAYDYTGTTALHYAARMQKPHTVSMLINLGANVNAIDSNGITPLMLAVKFLHDDAEEGSTGFDVVEELLNAEGIDVELTNEENDSALDIAASDGKIEMVEFLIRNDAKVSKATLRSLFENNGWELSKDQLQCAKVIVEKLI
jgi:ankyrin repeat protein